MTGRKVKTVKLATPVSERDHIHSPLTAPVAFVVWNAMEVNN